MLRTQTPHPEIVRIASNSWVDLDGASWSAKLIGALSHPDWSAQKTAQKTVVSENGETVFHFAPARRLEVRMEESWLKSKAVSMIGGTRCSTESDPRDVFRALLLNP